MSFWKSMFFFSSAVPTVCRNKLRWGCTRVTWSPLRPGLSPNVPKSGPRCSRTFCSLSLSWVSHLITIAFFLFFSFLPKDLIKSRACLRWAPATTERSVLLTQSSIMQLAHNMRRRCHLCLLSVPDSKMSGCPDLPQLCATCWYQKLSAALDKQPLVVHEKYHIYSSGSWLHRGRLNEKTKRHESGDAILGY